MNPSEFQVFLRISVCSWMLKFAGHVCIAAVLSKGNRFVLLCEGVLIELQSFNRQS